MITLVVVLIVSALAILCLLVFYFYCYYERPSHNSAAFDIESGSQNQEEEKEATEENLMVFQEGEDLTISDILDAPGEVIGKSNYGTLYKALLLQGNNNTVRLLRFLRPICASKGDEFYDVIQMLGYVRHQNLVPLLGFYAGPRGEKLLIHPFYGPGSLAKFITGGSREARSWTIIHRISVGIARGLDHLHTGLFKHIIHGNLKSKNILLDHNYQPHVSDYGLHLLLNPTAAQEMLEALADQGYKAPELIKMKETSEESDIYSLGVIFLELLTGREPVNEKASPDEDPYLPNSMRKAILDHRITDMYHPDILHSQTDDQCMVTEERILRFSQLAMACCSPSPSLRPRSKQVLRKLEEIGK